MLPTATNLEPGACFKLTLCMTELRVMAMCFSYFTDNSINSDWVHVLLTHNGHPVDGTLVGGSSPSPICCTLCGSAGAGTWTAISMMCYIFLQALNCSSAIFIFTSDTAWGVCPRTTTRVCQRNDLWVSWKPSTIVVKLSCCKQQPGNKYKNSR